MEVLRSIRLQTSYASRQWSRIPGENRPLLRRLAGLKMGGLLPFGRVAEGPVLR